MARVVLQDLVKEYRDGRKSVLAVDSIDLTIEDREFLVLVGPSGCGKSTTLRMIAGLEEATSGTIEIDTRMVNYVPPKDRDIAMVFQNYALYPHMSVFDNMAFGLSQQNYPRNEINRRVIDTAEVLGIGELLDRKPRQLSGGQRQRVAVGRAIVRKPKVFLFDEPLSNLDGKMRISMRAEISKLHTRLAATMVYVTHDQVEAMTMGDRICVMNDGKILQVAEPLELYHHPDNMFVAGFIGSPPTNFFRGRLENAEGRTVFLEDNAHGRPLRLILNERLARDAVQSNGKNVVLGIRPEDISDALAVAVTREETTVFAQVEVAEPMGAETFLYLDTGANSFVARVRSGDRYEVNQELKLHFNLDRAHLFDPDTEQVLRAD